MLVNKSLTDFRLLQVMYNIFENNSYKKNLI